MNKGLHLIAPQHSRSTEKSPNTQSLTEPLIGVFEDLSKHSLNYFGQQGPLQFQILEFKQKRLSDIWRCAVSSNGWQTRIYIKLHKNPDHQKDRVLQFCATEFEVLKKLHKAFADYEGFGVVRPVAFYPREMITITEEKTGANLYDILQKQGHRLASRKRFQQLEKYCYRCGQWLHLFQALTQTGKTVALRDMQILQNALERFQRWENLNLKKSLLKRVQNDLQQRLNRLAQQPVLLSGQHGDFIPFNVIVNANEITLLDFPYYTVGTVYHDLARFCTVLITMAKKPLFSRRRMLRLVKAIIAGFAEKAKFDIDIFRIYLLYNMVDWVLWDEWLNNTETKNGFWQKKVQAFYENWFRNFDRYAII